MADHGSTTVAMAEKGTSAIDVASLPFIDNGLPAPHPLFPNHPLSGIPDPHNTQEMRTWVYFDCTNDDHVYVCYLLCLALEPD